eukprot:COSAG02_NODE_6983_length_3248_cov_209.588441_3_plen_82_part_00
MAPGGPAATTREREAAPQRNLSAPCTSARQLHCGYPFYKARDVPTPFLEADDLPLPHAINPIRAAPAPTARLDGPCWTLAA